MTAFAQNAPEVLRPPKGSQVAIVVFEDLQCPDCRRAAPLLAEAGQDVQIPVVRIECELQDQRQLVDAGGGVCALFRHQVENGGQ
jgi:hypothetical protein